MLRDACKKPVTLHRMKYDRTVFRGPRPTFELGEPSDYLPEIIRKSNLILGTTLKWHLRRASNPFVIIGLIYPPRMDQFDLFES
jgi:hypothetical protein